MRIKLTVEEAEVLRRITAEVLHHCHGHCRYNTQDDAPSHVNLREKCRKLSGYGHSFSLPSATRLVPLWRHWQVATLYNAITLAGGEQHGIMPWTFPFIFQQLSSSEIPICTHHIYPCI